LRKSVEQILHNPANKQTNADENIASSAQVKAHDKFAVMVVVVVVVVVVAVVIVLVMVLVCR